LIYFIVILEKKGPRWRINLLQKLCCKHKLVPHWDCSTDIVDMPHTAPYISHTVQMSGLCVALAETPVSLLIHLNIFLISLFILKQAPFTCHHSFDTSTITVHWH